MRKKLIPWHTVLQVALLDGLSQADVARQQRCSSVAVHKACKRFDVKLPRAARSSAKHDGAFREAIIAGVTANIFCRQQGIPRGTLKWIEERNGMRLPRAVIGPGRKPKERAA